MSVKLLIEQHFEFLSLTGGCTGSSESTLVKMPHCWKSNVMAHFANCDLMSSAVCCLLLLLFKCLCKSVDPDQISHF